jgi:carboxyl-terminal processing protease
VELFGQSPRRRRGRATLALTILCLGLLLALGACTIPGTPIDEPTATVPATATTAAAAKTPTAAVTAPATVTATASATRGASATASITPRASATPTRATPPAANATPTRAAATPARGTATPGRGTATPGRVTATSVGGRGTPTATREPFTPTADEPCRDADLDLPPLPESAATIATIEQAYRCLLLHYVDRKNGLDNRVLLNGAWDIFKQAGLPAADVPPLALTGDRDADWQVYAARYNGLVQKYGRAIDTGLLARVALDGMARSLKDNHVAYLDPKLWRRFQLELSGDNKDIGPGFDLATDESSGSFYLYEVYPDTPAARAGLRAGDVIEQVNGRDAKVGTGNQGLYDLLTGAVGAQATMRVGRPATNQTLNVSVSVAEYSLPVISSRVLEGGVGYIKLRAFSVTADKEFDTALAALQARGITSLIFDVRQNGGGSTEALAHILSHFSHQGPHAITIDADGKRTEENPDPDVPLLGLPWVVLSNGTSASSADITAAFAKDRGGYLIGTKSAGALGSALVFELQDGSALEITVQRVLGPDGETINEVGVTPDQIVPITPADISAGNDPQLAAALTYLKTK